MFAPDVQVSGFTAADWLLALNLFRPPSRSVGRAGVVVVVQGPSGPLFALGPAQERLSRDTLPSPLDLEVLARRHRARWALRIDRSSLQRFSEGFGAAVEEHHDSLDQTLLALGLLQDLEKDGELEAWPVRLGSVPRLEASAVLRGVDLVLPAGQTAVFGAFDGDGLATALVLRRGLDGIDRIVGPDALRRPMGLLSGDWSRDYRYLVDVVTARFGAPALGVFAPRGEFERLGTSRQGAWARAVATRDVIVSPVAPALAVPLGLDAGLALARRVGRLSEEVGVQRWLTRDGPLAPFVQAARQQLPTLEQELESRLGFDPLALLRRLMVTNDG